MSSSAASRLLSYSSGTLQYLIRRHLLRSSTSATSSAFIGHLFSPIPDPQIFNNPFNADAGKKIRNENPSSIASKVLKKSNLNGQVPLGMPAIRFGDVDESGVFMIHTRRVTYDDKEDISGYSDEEVDSDFETSDDDDDKLPNFGKLPNLDSEFENFDSDYDDDSD